MYHAFPKLLPSGFIGVDIFFVISGFLITSIIVKEMALSHFSIFEFYGRRIRRIFPALLLVTFTVYALGWRSLLPSEYQQLGKHMAGSALFGANIVYWLESGYFDVASQLKPLLHLWSLGVEEQFYVVWPLVLLASLKLKIRPLFPILFLALCSFVANIVLIQTDPLQTFFLPHTRAWELAIGGLVALRVQQESTMDLSPRFASISSVTAKTVLSIFGAVLLVSAFFLIKDEKHFPGWYGVLPVLAAAILIYAGKDSRVVQLVLANRVMVAIGLISFPLYLWHWPLLSLLTILEAGQSTQVMKLMALAIALVLATLTYWLIEKPVRPTKSPHLTAIILLILMMGLGYLGYNTYARAGLGFRASAFQAISKAQGEWDFPGHLQNTAIDGVNLRSQAGTEAATTLFVGDSNLEQYYPRLDQLLQQPTPRYSILFLSEGGCLPIPHTISKETRECQDVANSVSKVLNANKQIRRVVIAAQWYGHLLVEVQNAKYVADGTEFPIGVNTEGYQKALNSLREQLTMLRRRGLEVYLILNIPIGIEFNPSYIAERSVQSLWQGFRLRTGGRRLSEFEVPFAQIKLDLSRAGKDSDVIVIDPTDTICSADLCSSVDENLAPKYKDNGHLRPTYVREHIRFMDQTIEVR
ncbi:acyltransferase family protein [Undibacterium cyanobacteriorum]|uniref:acyltransferase family protein n=1 Tax=Undibacterium cyanobacteriorum TaxID=3073561 RepID=UPI0035A3AC01